MSVYLDTSALIAVLDANDPFHKVAKQMWRELLLGEEPLVTTNYVAVQTLAVVQRRLGMKGMRVFHEEIYPALNVWWVDESTHRAAANALLAAGRRELSLVDSVSFEVMRRMGIERVFCFDPHFTEAGFQAIPLASAA